MKCLHARGELHEVESRSRHSCKTSEIWDELRYWSLGTWKAWGWAGWLPKIGSSLMAWHPKLAHDTIAHKSKRRKFTVYSHRLSHALITARLELSSADGTRVRFLIVAGCEFAARVPRFRVPSAICLNSRPCQSVRSQRIIALFTTSVASRWTKCPTFGTVTSVKSFSSHFQVSFSAPGSRY